MNLKKKDWAYGGCGVREEEIMWLKLDKEKMKEEIERLKTDNKSVY